MVAVAGFGCVGTQRNAAVAPYDASLTAYENAQFGFAFGYPSSMEARSREDDVRPTQYIGLNADFFLSLRDTVQDAKPTNVAWFYAIPSLDVDAFGAALVASSASGSVEVKSVEDVGVGGLALKKVVSSTEMGVDKTHYLLDRDGQTIVISVFLGQETEWDGVLQTLRSFPSEPAND